MGVDWSEERARANEKIAATANFDLDQLLEKTFEELIAVCETQSYRILGMCQVANTWQCTMQRFEHGGPDNKIVNLIECCYGTTPVKVVAMCMIALKIGVQITKERKELPKPAKLSVSKEALAELTVALERNREAWVQRQKSNAPSAAKPSQPAG